MFFYGAAYNHDPKHATDTSTSTVVTRSVLAWSHSNKSYIANSVLVVWTGKHVVFHRVADLEVTEQPYRQCERNTWPLCATKGAPIATWHAWYDRSNGRLVDLQGDR